MRNEPYVPYRSLSLKSARARRFWIILLVLGLVLIVVSVFASL